VPSTIASSPSFVAAFQHWRVCSGGTFRTAQDMERLRYCDSVDGPLVIEVADTTDFSALHGIEFISGLCGML
jgi:hypothetical protein